MPIIGNLPNNLQNGTTADASQVMADFNFIVNQVNANANQIGTLTAPSGTTMAFQQASAPLGWTAQTNAIYLDAFMRSVTPSAFSGSGGTVGAGNLILGPISGDGHVLSVAEMPAHAHTDSGHVHGTTENPHTHPGPGGASFYTNAASGANYGGGGTSFAIAAATGGATTSLTVNSSTANLQNTGGGGAHSHTLTANCKYVDQIVAVKS
ncbi:TPA: hypothetical protein QDB15_002093 [Burkholderia vietnamiensis]|uniref:hypothetical protein n=1 Tax=Burkholderia vietnamiensis TaxID=60552 RepID=UPI00075AAEF4|nr:hypothetical protein [Burkholderia vietnamiensis]KVS09183.1 hypothetical protein WK32_06855 [Burkholderia vietnamiensis]MCA8209652.1 hypothetical protein [Burkholderia vietnamiensis]HDR9098872.1 hypothetical protein [Burkholderia vietnamiensis]HDR9118328.1 hypothetical protein [Burkholderia vietnamiensis]HDR9166893.1 hypothetical protein [Burkholderia vietnamiensis]